MTDVVLPKEMQSFMLLWQHVNSFIHLLIILSWMRYMYKNEVKNAFVVMRLWLRNLKDEHVL